MENEMRFSANVMLIDVAFLNEIVCGIREYLSNKVGRELPNLDLPAWISYLSLDAGLRVGDNEIQVLLVHDEATHKLACCEPSGLDGLDGMACRTPLGEFTFSCVTPARITSCEELYLDLMNLTLVSADVKQVMLVPFHTLYGNRVEEDLRRLFKGKSEKECGKAVCFVMKEPLEPIFARWDFINYSLMQALGVKAEELKEGYK